MTRPVFQTSQIPLSHDSINVIIGRNGIGKTTLLDTLAGEIDEGGKDTQSVRPDTAYITQNHGLFDSLTVDEQVNIIRQVDSISGPEAVGNSRQAVDKLIGPLAAHRKTRMGSLSGGQAQLVSVWSACTLNRNLYLFDEPLSGVDPDNAPLIADAISSLLPQDATAEEGYSTANSRTIVLTLHSMEQILLFGDPWLIVLSDEQQQILDSDEDHMLAIHTPHIRAGKASSLLKDNAGSTPKEIFRQLIGEE